MENSYSIIITMPEISLLLYHISANRSWIFFTIFRLLSAEIGNEFKDNKCHCKESKHFYAMKDIDPLNLIHLHQQICIKGVYFTF